MECRAAMPEGGEKDRGNNQLGLAFESERWEGGRY